MRAALTLLSLIAALTFPLWAETPWATAVVDYVEGGFDPDPFASWVLGYRYPDSALGRPTVDTYSESSGVDDPPETTVVPVYPAWDPAELVTVGEGGHLILEMGTPISDHPANPYGVDFLVFANSFFQTRSGGIYDPDLNTPEGYTVANRLNAKSGRVAVSADGTTWFHFADGPTVGNMLPTLGRVWMDGAWGDPTDPTVPPDPDLIPDDISDMSLIELIRRYRGGAGGTGFDLEDLVVPHGVAPPAEFHFVRISVPDDGVSTTYSRTEIDAVTVVSPVDGYIRWRQGWFDWIGDPVLEQPGASPEGDAFDNWQEYARGGDPHLVETELFLPALSIEAGAMSFTLPISAREAPWRLETNPELWNPEGWSMLSPPPVLAETVSGDQVEKSMALPDSFGNYRLRLETAP